MFEQPSTGRPAGPGRRAALLALVVSVALVAVLQRAGDHSTVPQDDARRYMGLAWSVAEHGVFAEGVPGAPAPAPDLRYMPLYPVLAGLLMRLDPDLKREVECPLRRLDDPAGTGCAHRYDSIIAVQLALLALGYWLVWVLAADLTRSATVAWASLGALALCSWPLEFANQFLLEVPLITTFAALCLALARAARTGAWRWFVLAGACAAALILTKAVYLYVMVGVAALWLVLSRGFDPPEHRPRVRRGLVLGALTTALLLAPWLARNAVLTGKPALSHGYGASILVQRVAFNEMTPFEWFAAFIYWFPDVGDSIADRLFDPADVERLSNVGERSFYVVGNNALARQTADEARARGVSHMRYLATEHVVRDLPAHLAVTVPLVWRGVFISKWWGVLALACVVAVLPAVVRSRRLDVWLVFAAPMIVVVLHALASVSFPRYNLVMLPMLALSAGIVVARALGALRRRPDAVPALDGGA